MPYPMSSPVPLPNPLQDPATYEKYGMDAQNRMNEIAAKQALMQRNAKLGLLGKAGAMGGELSFFKTADPNNVGAYNHPAGDAAYDSVMNNLESEMEDQQAREALNRNIAMRLLDARGRAR